MILCTKKCKTLKNIKAPCMKTKRRQIQTQARFETGAKFKSLSFRLLLRVAYSNLVPVTSPPFLGYGSLIAS